MFFFKKKSLLISSVRLCDGSFKCQKYGSYIELQYLWAYKSTCLKYAVSYQGP